MTTTEKHSNFYFLNTEERLLQATKESASFESHSDHRNLTEIEAEWEKLPVFKHTAG